MNAQCRLRKKVTGTKKPMKASWTMFGGKSICTEKISCASTFDNPTGTNKSCERSREDSHVNLPFGKTQFLLRKNAEDEDATYDNTTETKTSLPENIWEVPTNMKKPRTVLMMPAMMNLEEARTQPAFKYSRIDRSPSSSAC